MQYVICLFGHKEIVMKQIVSNQNNVDIEKSKFKMKQELN
jgi:hypothetical protein